MLGMVRSAIARARGWVSALSSAVAPQRRERTGARSRRKPRPLGRVASGLVAGLALALAAPSTAFALSAGCAALNGFSGTYTVDGAGNGTDNWAPGAANGEVVTYSWSGNTKGAYVYVMYTRANGTVYAGLIDGTAASGSGSFTTSGTGDVDDFYEVGVQSTSVVTSINDPSKNNSTVNIAVSCAAAPPAPVASSFTYGSIVAYNAGGNVPTTLSVAGQVTNSPSNYAVPSTTTAQGGSVSIDSSGTATYVPPVGFRGNDSFTYNATNAGGTSGNATVTVAVGNPTFAMAAALPNGATGAAYSQQASLTGGKAPYSTFSASGLPAGLSMSASGLITGTPTQTGSFTVTVSAKDSSTGTGPYTSSAQTPLTIVSGADLQAALTGQSSVTAGQTASLTPRVTNVGTDAAANVTAQITLPSQITFSSLTAPAGWSCTTPAVGATGTVSCTKASVAAGAFETFTLTVGAGAAASPATTSLTFNVTSDTETETATKAFSVLAPDMQASLTGPASVVRGQNATLTLTMTNAGTAATPMTSWQTTLPAGLTFASLSAPGGWSCSTPAVGAGGLMSCGASSIAVGASPVFTLVVGVGAAAASPTTVNVMALTTYESEYPSASFNVLEAAPTVTSISPTAGPTSGGTTVVITGTNLSGATAVVFGATAATAYTINSATQITATAPAGSAGTVDVRVTTAGGTSATSAADQFTFIAAPTVTSLSPTAGPTGGGTTVVITGTGFSSANPTGAVKFGATNATYTINSNTQITATAPANSAGTYDVTVTTAGGTSATSAADQYTFVAAPTVTSLSPATGPTGGGTTVVITGTGFAAASGTGAVKFGATNATYTINSNTQITATAPANSAGTYDVT
ncbi:S-layer family protein, partial [Caulobacter sp. 17J80-11]|uniref:beta strand repeat-containing protein n=1 Tax=Caulobacter sp. 17J80-11 TaxID=2763502 RepID=UPI0016537A3D